MGDADVGAMDTGDAAASRALQMEGGSLPPRKRLLAGLKLNGLLSTSPPPVVSPTVESGVRKYEEGCMGCNAVDSSNGLRRIKRGGVSLRLCSACTLLYSKNMFCPHCLAMYHDASLLGDLSMWLVCTRCKRSVHPECEQKQSGSKPDAASYVCVDCVKRQRDANGGVTGMRSKHPGSGGRPSSPVDFVSPALKKPRMHRERRDHHGDGSRFERGRPDTTLGPPRKPVSSQASPLGIPAAPPAPAAAAASPQEAAVAAKNAAAAAVKVATAAKANAAAKAGAAVKAAAAAKAALEAAALAAKAEAACRAELRRKMGNNSETRLPNPRRLEINVHSEPRRERAASMKHERGDDGYGGARRTGAGSVDDEELARQLHRVINSSPRISRSMTPMRRKNNPSVKPETPSSGVSNSSAETTIRARPRTTNPSPVEPEVVKAPHEHDHHQFRHQQTRPRSITHKEFRRHDSRVSRHEVKTVVDEGGVEPPSSEPAVKSETDDASILFDALVEADGEGVHAASAAAAGAESSHDRRPDYLQEILEAAVLTDAAMFNDGAHHVVVSDLDTVRPEPEAAEPGQEPLDSSVPYTVAVPKDTYGDSAAEAELAGEVTVAMAGDTAMTETNGASVDITVTADAEDKEKASPVVVHDVQMPEMQEVVGSVNAAAELNEPDVTPPEPLSTSKARVEESSEAAEETTVGTDASTPSVTLVAVPVDEAVASESEVQAAAPQQSG